MAYIPAELFHEGINDKIVVPKMGIAIILKLKTQVSSVLIYNGIKRGQEWGLQVRITTIPF
jgi:hypothetical protein